MGLIIIKINYNLFLYIPWDKREQLLGNQNLFSIIIPRMLLQLSIKRLNQFGRPLDKFTLLILSIAFLLPTDYKDKIKNNERTLRGGLK